jgi:hypothetical protein
MGIFTKPAGQDELHLTACLPDPELPALEDRVKRVREACGWPLKLADDVKEVPGPVPDELALLRRLLPANS